MYEVLLYHFVYAVPDQELLVVQSLDDGWDESDVEPVLADTDLQDDLDYPHGDREELGSAVCEVYL
jgi:hypothetical protein